MAWMIPAAIVGSSLLGGRSSSKAAEVQASASDRAAELQRETAREQLALQQRMYEEGVARQQPFYSAGVNALSRMQGGEYALPPAFTGKVDLGQDPGYAFRLAEGQKALERSAAARGGLLSGATGKALTRFGQEMGSQEYQNAYSRALDAYNAQVQRSTTGYNRLASLAGVGQTTAEQLGAAGRGYAGASGNILGSMASNVGEAIGAGAQARASGYMGTAGAIGGGLNQYLNYQQNQAQNALLRQALAQRGGGGFGTGSAFGNQDYGQFF